MVKRYDAWSDTAQAEDEETCDKYEARHEKTDAVLRKAESLLATQKRELETATPRLLALKQQVGIKADGTCPVHDAEKTGHARK
eukprot:3973958-Pleurochrysis_carterae.AAC.1